MTTKEKIQTLFEENIGEFLSGEYIAEALSVSRNAVWKAVKSLRNDGYNIEAVSNKGYCLSAENDILSEKGVKKIFKSDLLGFAARYYPDFEVNK